MQRPKEAQSIGERIRVVDSGMDCLALNLDGISPMALALAQLGRHPKKVQATMRTDGIDIRVASSGRMLDRRATRTLPTSHDGGDYIA